MRIQPLFIILSCITLASCGDSDGIKDESFSDRMIREADCVIASERFLLFDEAKRHLEHGLEAGRIRFQLTKKPNDFPEYVAFAQNFMNSRSKSFNADFLADQCDTHMTIAQFDSGY